MKKLQLISRASKSGRLIYLVYENGVKVWQSSPTDRTYVAITFSKDKKGKFSPLNRFGRPDLMGKGESKHYWGRPDLYLASIFT